jgi:hypothetical protein
MVTRCQRRRVAWRALAVLCSADSLLLSAIAAFLPLADNCLADNLAARAYPPRLVFGDQLGR